VALDGTPLEPGRIDRPLVRAIARANQWRELLEAGEARTAYDLARHEGCRVSYVQRHLPLAFLAPRRAEARQLGPLQQRRVSGLMELGLQVRL
jgi:hypothetical protein